VRATAALLVLLAACATSDSIEKQSAKLGGYAYEAPASWHGADTREPRSVTTSWAPSAEDNAHKESLVVIRTQLDPALAKAGVPEVERLLIAAQRELPHLHLAGATTKFVTDKGLTALRLDSEFVPPGLTATYHRTHVALLDGTTLIHLIYTTTDLSTEGQALVLVLQSIHRGEG